MAHYNLLLFLSAISVHYASSLRSEGVSNGEPAPQEDFNYQVAIFGRRHPEAVPEFLGNGALVTPLYLLGIAQTFMQDSDTLKDYYFTVAVGHDDLMHQTAHSERFIVQVYIQHYQHDPLQNDIALGQLDTILTSLIPRLFAGFIPLPRPTDSFLWARGKVSGFGDNGAGETDHRRHFVNVQITETATCAEDYPPVAHNVNNFCGVAESDFIGLATGVCPNDLGSPLVVDDKIAGLVSRTHEDCDDTVRGALYTNVTAYYKFINATMNHNILLNVVAFITPRF